MSLGRVDFVPSDDALDAQLCFILTMLFKENVVDKVGTVEYGEGTRLWRLFGTKCEPELASIN